MGYAMPRLAFMSAPGMSARLLRASVVASGVLWPRRSATG